MLPEPLHPAVVHFPIVLVMLLPLFAAGALWAIRRGANPRRAWALPLSVAAVLTASAFVALRTGEAEEDRVEDVVGEAALHEHEEAAERFMLLSGVLLLVGGVGIARGTVGSAARLITLVGSIGLMAAGVQVGAAGGELVYGHNAASAYATGPAGAPAVLATPAAAQHTHERQDKPQIPESMRIEHEEIHGRLEAAAQEPGAVGDAARQLAAILEPHFRRENQIALPPLALLPALARGNTVSAMTHVLPLTDSLRAELPEMLEEHVHIAAAARRLERTAREHGNAEVTDLARTLQRHARTEEEVYYPAAVLVGDVVRARMRQDQ